MEGDDRARFCGLCRNNVYNLSSMSREAAVRLIEEHQGELCGRLYRRGDGTILTADCPVGARAFAVRVSQRFDALVSALAQREKAAVERLLQRCSLEAVKVLVEAGADLSLQDLLYQGTALGWAEYLKRAEIADYLRGGEASLSVEKSASG